MGVYRVVDRSMAKAMNAKIIDTKWIDINKGDGEKEDYRSRLVGKEYKDGNQPELIAGTPPLEALKVIASLGATIEDDIDDKVIMTNDVKRAYFNAFVARDVFIELPDEEPEKRPGTLGKLIRSLYGTRDAAMNWQTLYSEHLVGIGFTQSLGVPSVFFHAEKENPHHGARRRLCVGRFASRHDMVGRGIVQKV